MLYLADRYHADAITLEPRFAKRASNGAGWGDDVPNLEVIEVGGDHLQIVDEPYIAGQVGADLTRRLEQLKEGGRGRTTARETRGAAQEARGRAGAGG